MDRTWLSFLEHGHEEPRDGEVHRLETALAQLIEAKAAVRAATIAAGWPVARLCEEASREAGKSSNGGLNIKSRALGRARGPESENHMDSTTRIPENSSHHNGPRRVGRLARPPRLTYRHGRLLHVKNPKELAR